MQNDKRARLTPPKGVRQARGDTSDKWEAALVFSLACFILAFIYCVALSFLPSSMYLLIHSYTYTPAHHTHQLTINDSPPHLLTHLLTDSITNSVIVGHAVSPSLTPGH